MRDNHRRMRTGGGVLLAGMTMLLTAGCGPRGPAVVPVSGQVLVDGEPLATGIEGFIQVIPHEGRPATGAIDPQTGTFKLTTTKPDDGCVIGTHKVVIIMQQMVGQESVSLVPEQYRNVADTDLQVTIDGPTEALRVELTGPVKTASPQAAPISDDPNKF